MATKVVTIENAVLNSYTATPATVTSTSGRLTWTGVTNLIDMRRTHPVKASALIKKVYTAGTAKQIAITFDSVADSKIYHLSIAKTDNSLYNLLAGKQGLTVNPNTVYNGTEKYAISSGTGATTTTVAAAFAAAITAAITAGASCLVTATNAANVLTLVCSTANVNFDVYIPEDIYSSITTSVAQVVASLTPAQINLLTPTATNTATSGHSYTLYSYCYFAPDYGDNEYSNDSQNNIVRVNIFMDEADADYAAAVIAVDALNLTGAIAGV